jgi:hypothetical protein
MGQRLDKCKAHFKRNRDRYTCAALGIAAGATAVYLGNRFEYLGDAQ